MKDNKTIQSLWSSAATFYHRFPVLVALGALVVIMGGVILILNLLGLGGQRHYVPVYSTEETEATALRNEILAVLPESDHRHTSVRSFQDYSTGKMVELVQETCYVSADIDSYEEFTFNADHYLISGYADWKGPSIAGWLLPGVETEEDLTIAALMPFLERYILHADEFQVISCSPWKEGCVQPYPEYEGILAEHTQTGNTKADWLVTLKRHAGALNEETLWLSVWHCTETAAVSPERRGDEEISPGWYVAWLAAEYSRVEPGECTEELTGELQAQLAKLTQKKRLKLEGTELTGVRQIGNTTYGKGVTPEGMAVLFSLPD